MGLIEKRTATMAESDYYDELEILEEKEDYDHWFDGSYELSQGDYEGAILARDEFNSGRIS